MDLAPQDWWDDADRIIAEAHPRRMKAKFNTGSISRTAAVALRALAAWRQPEIVVEVGTFIGVSTLSLARGVEVLWTCDISNDCFDSNSVVRAHPYTKSTDLLRQLVKDGGWVDLFFFDGLLTPEDVPLIRQLSTPDTVFVFDDYNGQFKGVVNAGKLTPFFLKHVLIAADGPVKDDTTLAVLVPEAYL